MDIELWTLVLTNIFYLLPAIAAIRSRFFKAMVAYIFMAVISGTYHYVIYREECLINEIICPYPMLGLDHFWSYLMIYITFDSVVFMEQKSEEIKCSRDVYDILSLVILLFLVFSGFGTTETVIIFVALTALFSLTMMIICDIKIVIDVYDFLIGAIVIGLGTWSFYQTESYWIYHSIWHFLGGVGMSLMIESKNTETNIINKLTCGKYCKRKVFILRG